MSICSNLYTKVHKDRRDVFPHPVDSLSSTLKQFSPSFLNKRPYHTQFEEFLLAKWNILEINPSPFLFKVDNGTFCRERMACNRRSLIRETRSDSLPCLPTEIIDYILSFSSTSQLVATGWNRVSLGFSDLISSRIRRCKKYNLAQDRELYEFLKPIIMSNDLRLFRYQANLLSLLSKRLFPAVSDLTLPVGIFAHLHYLSASDSTLSGVLENVKKLTINIGRESGHLNVAQQHFDHLNDAKSLFGTNILKEIHLVVNVCDAENVTCCGFRELVRFLKESSDQSTEWDLSLHDWTTLGQGWFGPTQLTKYRNQAFVCYLRTLPDLGVTIRSLELIDERKPSPYMLIMRGSKHRAMYMFPEFKNCQFLFVRYDIGVVAPTFAHERDRFLRLEEVDIAESHVLYKTDLLSFLGNAPILKNIKILLPASWCRRTSECSLGCFKNEDFSCFRADGWCTVTRLLPQVQLSFCT